MHHAGATRFWHDIRVILLDGRILSYCTSNIPQRHSEVIATPPRFWGCVGRSLVREQGWPTRALSVRAPSTANHLGLQVAVPSLLSDYRKC
jgi:hypothetical protein